MNEYILLKDELINKLKIEMGPENVVTEPSVLRDFDCDASALKSVPQVMVTAKSTEQISRLLTLANRHNFPVVPRGAGTGLCGGCLTLTGGVLLSMTAMNRIRAIDTTNLIAEVEPGLITRRLRDAASEKGLFYPPDPASLDESTIGGNAATNAGGPSCLKYGVTRDYVLGLEAVLPTGKIIRTGQKTRKGVVGYDLTHLLVGSEGTLAVITGLTLKLIPHPPAVRCMGVVFPDLPSAMQAVIAIQVKGFLPAAIEFMDHKCLKRVHDLTPFKISSAKATLLIIEVDGDSGQIKREIKAIGNICREIGATDFLYAENEKEREQIWEMRRQTSTRIHDAAPIYIPEDVTVPIGKIADLVSALPTFEKKFGLDIYAFGHAGDGNIHLNITAPARDHPGLHDCVAEILKLVVKMEGTISGEHGIGFVKKKFLPLELSAASIDLQKGIKNLFDPKNILNPGKIF